METLIDQILTNLWTTIEGTDSAIIIMVLFLVLELVFRLIPTSRNISILLTIYRILDKVIGNRVNISKYLHKKKVDPQIGEFFHKDFQIVSTLAPKKPKKNVDPKK